MSINKRKIRQFKCPSCGGQLELQNARTKYVACPYCGSVADASSDAYKVLTEGLHPEKFKTRSFLKLGMTGVFDGKTYKIIGRTAWKSDYYEYWSEDGESGYSHEIWTYDEWLLINEDGIYKTILEDDEGYKTAVSYIPKYPYIANDTSRGKNFDSGRKVRIKEYGKSEILYFEGESTYLVKPGDSVKFSMYGNSTFQYSAEWRYDEIGNMKEVEFFIERKLSKADLMEAFKDDPSLKEIYEKAMAKFAEKKINKKILIFAGLINIILGILFSNIYSNTGQSIDKRFDAYEIAQTSPWVTDSVKRVSFITKDRLRITPDDEYVYVYLNPELGDSVAAIISFYMLNDKSERVFEIKKYYYNIREGYTPEAEEYQLANNISSINKTFEVNVQKDENYRVGVDFIIPKDLEIKKSYKLYADVRVSTIPTQHNTGTAFLFGFILLIVGFTRKTKF